MKNDAIYGAIAGDVIGSAYEFKGARFEPIQLFKRCCQFTDDTVLTVAVTDWLTKGDCCLRDKLIQYARNYFNAGYGSHFAKWVMSKNPQPYNSCGNGSAMRVSAVGCVAKSLEEALHLAKESAMPTHNHPEGIKGAESTAAAIFLARHEVPLAEISDYIVREFGYDLSRTLDEIRPDYCHVEDCMKTMPEAFECFLESDSYESCLRNVMYIGGDADTLAAIAGSVAEAMWGVPEEIVEGAKAFVDEEVERVVRRFYGRVSREIS